MSCSVKFGQGQVKQLVAHGKGLLHYSNGRLLSSPSIQVAFPLVLSWRQHLWWRVGFRSSTWLWSLSMEGAFFWCLEFLDLQRQHKNWQDGSVYEGQWLGNLQDDTEPLIGWSLDSFLKSKSLRQSHLQHLSCRKSDVSNVMQLELEGRKMQDPIGQSLLFHILSYTFLDKYQTQLTTMNVIERVPY